MHPFVLPSREKALAYSLRFGVCPVGIVYRFPSLWRKERAHQRALDVLARPKTGQFANGEKVDLVRP